MLALGPPLKALVAVFDAPLQWLVVACLKVQAVHPFQRSPVTLVPLGLIAIKLEAIRLASRSAINSSQFSGIVVAMALKNCRFK
jgi:hypothetical protein